MKFDYNNSFNGIVDDTSELLSDIIYNIILYKYNSTNIKTITS